MPVMTIISCKIFEDELVWLMQRDPSFENLIADNGEIDRFCEKLDACNIPYMRVPPLFSPESVNEPAALAGSDAGRNIRVILLMAFALHAVVKKLKAGVYEKICEMKRVSDGIFLMYGLCGNALLSVEEELSEARCPVIILRDAEGTIADDCIGALVGGRRVYQSMLKSFHGAGTFIMMPKWAACWRELAVACGFSTDPNDMAMMGTLMEMANYRQVMKLDTGLMYEPRFEENVKEFSDIFGFRILTMAGNQDIVSRCYDRVRKAVLKESGA